MKLKKLSKLKKTKKPTQFEILDWILLNGKIILGIIKTSVEPKY